jgi:glycosyltransferase involved in cell wall biosynthesis
VVPNLPVPIRQGLDLRAWTVIDALCELGPVAVFAVRPDEPAPPPRSSIEHWTTSSDPHFATTEPGADMSWLRSPDGSPGDAYITDQSRAELADLIARFAPDVVVIQEVRLHRYIDVIDRTRCRVVLDSSNVHSGLLARVAGLTTDRRTALLQRAIAGRLIGIETSVYASADQVWACSAVDEAEIHADHPDADIRVVPNTIDPDRYDASDADRLRVVFPAMFAFPPNEAAARTLITDVMPLVRVAEPSAELVLVGSHPTRRLVDLCAADGVEIRGPVADMVPELAHARVMAVPLTVGSGTRYKLLEAFASRLPVVTSSVGAEGLDVVDGVHVLIAETPSEFADAIVRLWRDPALAEGLADAAHRLLRERYSFVTSRVVVAAAVHGLLSGV